MQNGAVCSSELVAGGVNVFSCTQSDVFTNDHLVIMVNGILDDVCRFQRSFGWLHV
ncbi:hypothetical protein HanPSC8_Chr03g0125331 [Helianthus annuus]|nr:hypothetical protein HanPSC8_Chr03g0125331 [Helianthus annuus]